MTSTKETQFITFLHEQIAQRAEISIDSITADTQLVDLGMQSIEAVLLCGDLEDNFGVEIDPADIFEHDTVGGFAQSILSRMDQ